MSVPALRQPKFLTDANKRREKKNFIPDSHHVVLTLKDNEKLVVSSDAYHGIITIGDMYKCVLCQAQLELDVKYKETHKTTAFHTKMLETYPHVDEYSFNLIRQVPEKLWYCTICNVVIANTNPHLRTEVHQQELEKAVVRASTYKVQ